MIIIEKLGDKNKGSYCGSRWECKECGCIFYGGGKISSNSVDVTYITCPWCGRLIRQRNNIILE